MSWNKSASLWRPTVSVYYPARPSLKRFQYSLELHNHHHAANGHTLTVFLKSLDKNKMHLSTDLNLQKQRQLRIFRNVPFSFTFESILKMFKSGLRKGCKKIFHNAAFQNDRTVCLSPSICTFSDLLIRGNTMWLSVLSAVTSISSPCRTGNPPCLPQTSPLYAKPNSHELIIIFTIWSSASVPLRGKRMGRKDGVKEAFITIRHQKAHRFINYAVLREELNTCKAATLAIVDS